MPVVLRPPLELIAHLVATATTSTPSQPAAGGVITLYLTETSSILPSSSTEKSSSGGLNQESKIGIGVGLGVGIPGLVIAALTLWKGKQIGASIRKFSIGIFHSQHIHFHNHRPENFNLENFSVNSLEDIDFRRLQ